MWIEGTIRFELELGPLSFTNEICSNLFSHGFCSFNWILVNSALSINFCHLIYEIIQAIIDVSISTLCYGFRSMRQFLHLCYEVPAMHIITMNTLSSSMLSGEWMRLCKASKLVLAQKNPTSKEHCYGIQLSVPSTTAGRSMEEKQSALFSKHNNSFAAQIVMWDVVGRVLFGFFVSLVGFF